MLHPEVSAWTELHDLLVRSVVHNRLYGRAPT